MFWRNSGATCSAGAVQVMVNMDGKTRKLGTLLPVDSAVLPVREAVW